MNGNLEQELTNALLDACRVCREELNYNPAYFLQMLHERRAVETAVQLVSSPVPAEGFTKMWEKGALHLTVEAHVIKPTFRPLFAPQVIEKARERLRQHGYEESPEES